MNTNFIYHVPTRIYFGDNQIQHLGSELKKYGQRVLLIYGGGTIKRIGLYDKIQAEIKKAGLECYEMPGVAPNPRHTTINRGAEICRKEKIDVLLAVGGGSVIDVAKFISPATFYDGDAWDFFTKKAKMTQFLPVVTIPTISGTGSEMDAYGIAGNLDTEEKIALYHPQLMPKASFLDPTVTYSVNHYQTACTGIDSLAHYLETYFMKPNLFMLESAMEGFMKTILKYLPVALQKPTDYEARSNLMWVSSWALNGFTQGSTRQPYSAHRIADELTAKYGLIHGLALAIVLPRFLSYTLNDKTAPLYKAFACNVLGIDASLPDMDAAKAAIAKLEELFFKTCELPNTLTALGVDDGKLGDMAEAICRGDVLKSYVDLTKDDIVKIYQMCL